MKASLRDNAPNWARWSGHVRVAAVVITALVLPWSNVLVSNAQFLLVLAWLVEGIASGDLMGRFRWAFTSRWSLVFLAFLALHLVGLAWTSDLEWGMDLCRILAPVLVFGTILSSSPPLGRGALWWVLRAGAWSVVLSTLVCLLLRGDALASGDHRAVSIFISHVRLGLLIALAVPIFLLDREVPRWARALQYLAAAWAVTFLVLIGSLSGISALVVAFMVLCWWAVRRLRAVPRWGLRTMVVVAPLTALLVLAGLLWPRASAPLRQEDLEVYAPSGEAYYHDVNDPQKENGQYVWTYVAGEELERGWARRSHFDLYGKDERGQPLRGTLVRYMASMGLRKDSLGLLALTDEDVSRIEQGMPSVRTGRQNILLARIDQLRMELDRYRAVGDPNGHSLTMRIEFWRTGWWIARQHLWTGVGTGDTRPAFAEAYEARHSPLKPEWRHRAHNEYLTLLISFGVFGLLLALSSWIAPAVALRAYRQPLFLVWAAIFLVSCLTEDTVETQTGATFFALYYALFVFGARALNADVAAPAARESAAG
ncbi:MAG: O-antigen ligase family protein [Flavobacteriales bacterium]|jgi:hypothetical protein|nr:O-antigen ligase family protein [Flavobacteriales bacterium]MBK6753164.1 O-antigen ligase family protein [Flavobacteriales bacterium]MBK7085101.1 O-antigen ligase family protein [Flavobacteriales bacterium]MBK7269800.1 O-antigen ligase family protein [Flavobacteriales bacterium]MBK7752645.1 O-antigen ligase family protein [Flavobacteriales bacterium]